MASPSTMFEYGPTCASNPTIRLPSTRTWSWPPDPGDRAAHRQVRGVIDVELVDLAHGRGADPDRHRPRPDERSEPFALRGGERLGVADPGDPVTARAHDHGGRHDGAAGRRDAHLVDADDPLDPRVPETALVAEGRDDRSHRPIAYRNRATPPDGRGRGVAVRVRGRCRPPAVSRWCAARAASRPCRRGRAGSTAGRAGRRRAGRPRSSRCAGC